MVEIRHAATCDAPLDVTFAYLDDYRNAPNWMFGLARFEPVGGRALEPIVAISVRHSDAALRKQIEDRYARRASG